MQGHLHVMCIEQTIQTKSYREEKGVCRMKCIFGKTCIKTHLYNPIQPHTCTNHFTNHCINHTKMNCSPLEYSISMVSQISAKRQLLGHNLPGSFPQQKFSGCVRQRWCELARVLFSWLRALQRSNATHSSLGQNTQPRKKLLEKSHLNFSTPPTFLCRRRERERRGTTREKRKKERERHKWETDSRPYLVGLILIWKVM